MPRKNCPVPCRHAIPIVLEGSVNGDTFSGNFELFPAPIVNTGNVVVDNFSRHKAVAVRRAIQQAGVHRLLLLPCISDFDPILQVF